VTAPSGSTTLSRSFQFLASSQIYANPGLYKFVLYDASRQQVFLTATDHVDVFDLQNQVFRAAIQPPPNGPPPNAALRGLALTPDHSQLVVADFGAQSVYLIDPDGAVANGAKVAVGGVAGYLNSGPARVVATSAQTVFVGLSGEGSSTGACNACLGQLNIAAGPPVYQPAPQPEVTSLTGAPLLQADASGDTVYLTFSSAPGGPVASWSASAPNDFAVSSANDLAHDLAVSSDGTMFAMRTGSQTSAELEGIAQRVAVPGLTLHTTGALVYELFLDGPAPAAPPATGIHGGIDIRDAHNGRLRLRVMLPEPFAMLSTDVDGLHGNFLTSDEFGQRLFAVTASGLTIVQLANVPLGFGSVAPASGAAAGGTSVTIRGSGFQSATKVTLGGKPASVTFKDMNTLNIVTPALSAGPQQLDLINPDGEFVAFDAAFFAQ
jgi:IPT/TIG domain